MQSLQSLQPRISVAPMMDWTTKDYRFFARLFNPNVVLYTEMVTTGAILFGDAKRHLGYNAQEHPNRIAAWRLKPTRTCHLHKNG